MCYKGEEGVVSVIIPVYNCQQYILQCLQSISRQSYKKLQIIIVDDGSTDDSYETICNYTENSPEFIVLHKENGGVSSARNMALKYVSGEYIFFLDADDCIEENAIENLVAAMRKNHADWVSCQYSRWGTEGNRLDDYHFITGVINFNTNEDRISFATERFLRYYVGYEVWDKLYCSDRILNNRILFSEKCSIGEDLAFNLKYLMHSKKLVCIEERCVRYNVREDSTMGKLSSISRKLRENSILLEDVYDYVSSIDNEVFLKKFSLLCYMIFDTTYIGYSPKEICDGYKEAGDISFIMKRYEEIERAKKDVIALFPDEIAEIKFRYHMFVYHSMTKKRVVDRVKIFFYDMYRKKQGRQPMSEWKMPY